MQVKKLEYGDAYNARLKATAYVHYQELRYEGGQCPCKHLLVDTCGSEGLR
jgi:hypothetical protein